MKKIYIFSTLFFTVIFPNITFSSSYEHDDDITGWVGYEQQLGVLDDKFITYGGSSAGISIFGISLGVGLYGNFPYKITASELSTQNLFVIYGGGIIGYKSPILKDIFGFRLNTLLGYATFEVDNIKTGHFLVAPSFYLDFYIFDDIALSLGVTYRYFHNMEYLNINKTENSFAGSISISWIND